MAKAKLESGAQVRIGHQDGAWRFSVYGPKSAPGETGGHVGTLKSFGTFDEVVAAFKDEYEV